MASRGAGERSACLFPLGSAQQQVILDCSLSRKASLAGLWTPSAVQSRLFLAECLAIGMHQFCASPVSQDASSTVGRMRGWRISFTHLWAQAVLECLLITSRCALQTLVSVSLRLYCDACHSRLFEEGEESSFVPFRDRASLESLRGMAESTAASSASARAQPISTTVRKRWSPYKSVLHGPLNQTFRFRVYGKTLPAIRQRERMDVSGLCPPASKL